MPKTPLKPDELSNRLLAVAAIATLIVTLIISGCTTAANQRDALSNQQALAYGSYIDDLSELHELLWTNLWWTPETLPANLSEDEIKLKSAAVTSFWNSAQRIMGKSAGDSAKSTMVAGPEIRRQLTLIDGQRDKTLLDFKCASGIQQDACNPKNRDHDLKNRGDLMALVDRDTLSLRELIKTLKEDPRLGRS